MLSPRLEHTTSGDTTRVEEGLGLTPGLGVADDALDHWPASPQAAFQFVHPFVHIVNR